MYPVLTQRRNFLTIRHAGEHYRSRCFILQIAPIKFVRLSACHVGITCSSKVGGAVIRNRVKRRLRVIIKTHFSLFLQHYAYVVIARPVITHKSFHTIAGELKYLLNTVKHHVA